MSSLAIDELVKKRAELDAERQRHYTEYSTEIERLDIAIKLLSGKSVQEIQETLVYDDDSPTYIKNNEDGI